MTLREFKIKVNELPKELDEIVVCAYTFEEEWKWYTVGDIVPLKLESGTFTAESADIDYTQPHITAIQG